MSLGINLGSLQKMLKCAGNDDTITLRAQDGGNDITATFESQNQTRVSHFSLKLMDIDSEHLGIPDTEYQCVARMQATEFQRICKELAILGDTVKITANKDGIKFDVAGDLGTGAIVFKPGDGGMSDDERDDNEALLGIKAEEETLLTFALRYLNFFAKATPLSSAVTLKMSPDVPLVVEYMIADGNLGHLRFYLAPKARRLPPHTLFALP